MTVALPPWQLNSDETTWLPWQWQNSGDDYTWILYSWYCSKGNEWIRCEQKKSCRHGDWASVKDHGNHADMVTDRSAWAGAGTMCVSLCVYLSNVAVSFVTEGEITQPTTQTESIRNKQNIHMPKKKTLSTVTLVVHLLLLYTEQREARKRKKKQQRYWPWKPL